VRISAYDRFKPGVTMETIEPDLAEEVAKVWRLWKAGVVRENYARAEEPSGAEAIGAGRAARSGRLAAIECARGGLHMRRLAVMTALAALVFPATPATADVSDPSPPIQSCLGIATGQRASTLHDVGEHASSFDEPRQGLGNVAFRVFDLDSMGEFGSVLAAIDGIDATHCP
jgi:hypothetical protein